MKVHFNHELEEGFYNKLDLPQKWSEDAFWNNDYPSQNIRRGFEGDRVK